MINMSFKPAPERFVYHSDSAASLTSGQIIEPLQNVIVNV
jgi:hypothetical protein